MKKLTLALLFLLNLCNAVELTLVMPAFPDILTSFNSTEHAIQHILTINFFGTCLAALFMGPLSDKLGRRPLLIYGELLLLFGCILCFIAPTLPTFYLGRFLMGLGAGATSCIAYNFISDRYPPQTTGTIIGSLRGLLLLSSGIAPLIGSYLTIHYNWHAPYLLLILLAFLSLATALILPESLPSQKRTHLPLSTIYRGYFTIIKNKQFLKYLTIQGLSCGAVSIWNSAAALLFINHLKINTSHYAIYQSIILITGLAAYFSVGHSIKTKGLFHTKKTGTYSAFFAATLLLATIPLHLTPLTVLLFSLFHWGQIYLFASTMTSILYFFPTRSGAASALTAATRYTFCALCIALFTLLPSLSLLTIALSLLILSSGCLLLFRHLDPSIIKT